MTVTQINKPNVTIPADVWTELLPAMSSATVQVGSPAQIYPFHSKDAQFFVGAAPPTNADLLILIEGFGKLNRWGNPLTFGSDDPAHKLYGKPVDPGRPALIRLMAISTAGAGVDVVARDLAQAVTGEPGEDVPTGETRFIVGRDWYNPTAAAVAIPGTPTVANLAALGLIEDVPNASTELYDTVQTAADVTHTALARGVKVFSNAGARIARLPTGIAVGQERRFIRNGPGNVDIFIADGATEIIYTRNATTGALENAADGGVRLNFDEGWVLIKKISATAWEVYDRPNMMNGGGTASATATPTTLLTATTPPATPTEGTSVAVVAVATGVFAGQEGKIATFTGGAWTFAAAADGTSAVIGGMPSRYSVALGIWVADPVVNTVTPAGGTIASLTAGEQALIGPDTRVILANGLEAQWNGTAPKTNPANYTTTLTVIDGKVPLITKDMAVVQDRIYRTTLAATTVYIRAKSSRTVGDMSTEALKVAEYDDANWEYVGQSATSFGGQNNVALIRGWRIIMGNNRTVSYNANSAIYTAVDYTKWCSEGDGFFNLFGGDVVESNARRLTLVGSGTGPRVTVEARADRQVATWAGGVATEAERLIEWPFWRYVSQNIVPAFTPTLNGRTVMEGFVMEQDGARYQALSDFTCSATWAAEVNLATFATRWKLLQTGFGSERVVTGTATIDLTDELVIVNATGPMILTLPNTANTAPIGRHPIEFKFLGVSAVNTVTLQRAGVDQIQIPGASPEAFATTAVITTSGGTLKLYPTRTPARWITMG